MWIQFSALFDPFAILKFPTCAHVSSSTPAHLPNSAFALFLPLYMSCMVDTIAHPSPSSDSSLSIDTPPIFHSRQPSLRHALRHNTARLHNLNLSRHRRHVQRLHDAGFSPTSTDDEGDTAVYTASVTILNAALTALSAPSPHLSRSILLRRKRVRKALKRLPRPSQVVQHTEEGSASDFGLGNESRKAHRRRVSATVVGVQYLNRKGDQDAVPRWTLERRGLKKYTAYLQPPKEDRYIQKPLADKSLLSHHYRGTFLTLYRLGQKRKVRQRLFVPTRSSDSGAQADYEYLGTTSEFDITSTNTKGGLKASNHAQLITTREEDGSKRALVEQVLAEIGSNSSNSKEDGDDSSSDKAVPASSAAEEISAAHPEPNFVDEIMNMLESNPNALTQVATPDPAKAQAPRPEEKKLKEKREVTAGDGRRANDVKPPRPLSKFDREKKKGMVFCQIKRPAKRARSGALLSSHLEPQRQRRKLNEDVRDVGDVEVVDAVDLAPSETVNYGNASRMMQKMGFTGRLGAKEDGVMEPIEAKRNAGRSGLGSTPLWRQEAEGSKLGAEKSVEEGSVRGTAPSVISVRATRKMTHITNRLISGSEVNEDSETERGYEGVDNGRRAILVDVDALIKNSRKRRIDAFQRVAEAQNSSEQENVLEKLCRSENKDLCDSDCIWKMMEAGEMEKNDEVHESLQKGLDEAFQKGDDVDVNVDLVELLQKYSKKVYFGLFHRGSERRLKAEVGCVSGVLECGDGAMGLPDILVRAPRVTVKKGEEWPYKGSWHELLCRVGVQASQGVFVVGESVAGDAMSCGVAAGIVLGARMLTTRACQDGVKIRTNEGGGKGVELSIGRGMDCLTDDVRNVFQRFLQERKKWERRRRVLGLYSGDALWYCGREEIGPGDGIGAVVGRSMIRFYKLDRVEWVESENVVELPEEKVEKLRERGFPGLFEPTDVDEDSI